MGKETDLSIRQSIHNSTIQIGSKNVNIVIVKYNSRDGRTSSQCNLVKMNNKNITVIPLENATEDNIIKEYYYQDEQEITEEKFYELYNKYFKN